MRISIIAEEKLTHKVLAGLKNNFAVSGLERSLNVLIDKGVNALATIYAVADLDRVAMVTQMNARTLNGTIAVDVEDFGMAWDNALGRLLQILQIRVDGKGPPTVNDPFMKPSRSISLTVEVR